VVPLTNSAFVLDGADQPASAVGLFRDYPKVLSWLVLHAAGLPALRGVVITRWDAAAAATIERFATSSRSEDLLIRSDSSSETGRAPRGGYLIGVSEVGHVVGRLLDEGRLVFMLEPASPLDDLYSLCLEPAADWRDWMIEVVGPGFDASDLKRGDVTPHERLDVRLDNGEAAVRSRVVASPRVQAAVRRIRFEKAATLLRCAVADVEDVLRRRGETMLLDAPTYLPIPDELLAIAVEHAAQLQAELAARGLSDRHVSISMSFIGRGARPVFWDIVWPSSKYVVGDV